MSALVIIQARMGSSRLPGKALAKIGELTAVEHVYQRALRVAPAENVVIAMPDTPEDAALATFLRSKGIGYCVAEGVEDWDLLARFAYLFDTQNQGALYVVRLTADCPFLDCAEIPAVLAGMILGGKEYATNVTQPRTVPDGYDVEAYTVDALGAADQWATDSYDREHVGPWVRRNRSYSILYGPSTDFGRHRWTLDTPEDLAWFRAVAEHIDVTPPHPTSHELLTLIHEYPELARYNA